MNGYAAIKPLLFRLKPEQAHSIALGSLKALQSTPIERAIASRTTVDDARLKVETLGCTFRNPVGVAAGFDKNARVPNALGALGFGHVEVGGITANPQRGNPRPRLFRLPEDRAVINRMGFNNEGADSIGARLQSYDRFRVPIGINIGLSKTTDHADAPADYRYSYEQVAPVGDYFVINVSSPNTPGLRQLQSRDRLERIIDALADAGASPLLIKLSPDLSESAVEEVIDVATVHGLDGLIAVNTTTERPASLSGRHREETGGLSGAPLAERAVSTVGFIAERTDLPVIGVGGIDGPEAAYRMIKAGASLVQLYTGLVYEGPGIARHINAGLLSALERDGYDDIEHARGDELR